MIARVANRHGFEVVARAPSIESAVFDVANLSAGDWHKIAETFNPRTNDSLMRVDIPDYSQEGTVTKFASPEKVSIKVTYLYEEYNITAWIDFTNNDRGLDKSAAMSKKWSLDIAYSTDNFTKRQMSSVTFKSSTMLRVASAGLVRDILKHTQPMLKAAKVLSVNPEA